MRVCPKSGRVNVVKSLRPGRTSGNNSVVLDVMANSHNEAGIGGEGECDPATGKRKICVKKYETECRTRYVKQMMMDDQPRDEEYLVCGNNLTPYPNQSSHGCLKVGLLILPLLFAATFCVGFALPSSSSQATQSGMVERAESYLRQI